MRWTSGAWLLMTAVVIWATGCAAQTSQSAMPPPPDSPASAEKPLLILIDAAHGGSDPGARLTPTASEKDVTLALARRLRQELNARGFLCQMVRDGDTTLSADQRATLANTSGASLYVALHASSLGSGIRVFTAMLPVGGDNQGPFLNWETAQSVSLAHSQAIQEQLIAAIQKTRFPARGLMAPLRPLNNVRVPAIAIEISPTTGDATQVAATGYQAMICSALANALATITPALRGNTGNHP